MHLQKKNTYEQKIYDCSLFSPRAISISQILAAAKKQHRQTPLLQLKE